MRTTVTVLAVMLAAAGCSVSGTTPPPPPDTMSQILASVLPTANQAVGCALADSANSDAAQDLHTMATDRVDGGQAPVPFTAAGDLTKALGELTQAQADAKDSPNGLGDDVGWLKVTLQELLTTVQAAPEGGDIPADSMDWAGYAQHTGYVVADCKAFGYGWTSVPFTVAGS